MTEIKIGDIITTSTNRKPRIVTDLIEIDGLGPCVVHKPMKDGKAYGKATTTMREDAIPS